MVHVCNARCDPSAPSGCAQSGTGATVHTASSIDQRPTPACRIFPGFGSTPGAESPTDYYSAPWCWVARLAHRGSIVEQTGKKELHLLTENCARRHLVLGTHF